VKMISDLFILTPVIIFIAALICEFIDSHLGGGFGTILTPLFLIFGFPRLTVVHSILVSEIVTGFEGGGLYHSFKKVDWTAAAALSLTAIIGIFIAVFISVQVSSFIIKLYIGILVAVLGVFMLLKLKCKTYKLRNSFLIGGLIGFNKALTGGGFGPIAVAGLCTSGLETKKSLGTTLIAEGVTCSVSLLIYYFFGQLTLVLSFLIPLTFGAFVGSYLGSNHTKKTSDNGITLKAGVTILLLGLFVIVQTLLM
jgi:uncharacterized membrane protein YfcA